MRTVQVTQGRVGLQAWGSAWSRRVKLRTRRDHATRHATHQKEAGTRPNGARGVTKIGTTGAQTCRNFPFENRKIRSNQLDEKALDQKQQTESFPFLLLFRGRHARTRCCRLREGMAPSMFTLHRLESLCHQAQLNRLAGTGKLVPSPLAATTIPCPAAGCTGAGRSECER